MARGSSRTSGSSSRPTSPASRARSGISRRSPPHAPLPLVDHTARMITWDDVLALGRELPETEESTSYGRPSLKVRGKSFVTLRSGPMPSSSAATGREAVPPRGAPGARLHDPALRRLPYLLVRLEAPLEEVRELVIDSWLSWPRRSSPRSSWTNPELRGPRDVRQFAVRWRRRTARRRPGRGHELLPLPPRRSVRRSISTTHCFRVYAGGRLTGRVPRRPVQLVCSVRWVR